jgi:hypothetical protein
LIKLITLFFILFLLSRSLLKKPNDFIFLKHHRTQARELRNKTLPSPPISAVATTSALADALCPGTLLPLIFSLPSLSI